MSVIRGAATDKTGQGITIILASVITMAFADAVVKLFSSDLTVWQIFATRSLIAIPLLLVILILVGTPLRVISLQWVIIRSTLLVATWLIYYGSFPFISLSVAAVAVYTNPIMTTLLSAVMLGEKVTTKQWLGVFTGFLGVVAILKPGSDAFSWAVALPLVAAFLYSTSMLLTRAKCQNEEPLILGLSLHVVFVIIGGIAITILSTTLVHSDTQNLFPFLLKGWAPMDIQAWIVMAVLGILSAAYFVGVARAYQIAAPSIIATFDYMYLVSAAVWGFVFFAESPDTYTVLGMVLITTAGLLVSIRRS